MRQITRFFACCILAPVFFTGCKIENHSPQDMVQAFVSSKECMDRFGFWERLGNADQKIEVDSEVVRLSNFSSDSECRHTQFAVLEYARKNPNRAIVFTKKVGFVENNKAVFGVMVYSRKYTKPVPVSDGELHNKSMQ